MGVRVSAIDLPMAVEEVERWIVAREQNYVAVTGAHGVIECQRDPDLRRIHNQSGLTTPDGMPVVWACRRAGAKWVSRVYGPDLMLALCDRAARQGWTSYFYGGGAGVPEQLANRLVRRFPELKVVGTYSPPFRPLTEDEDQQVVDNLNRADPDLLWVGLSTPKQERWMDGHMGRVSARALLGVGAAFDIHAGLVRQAPVWMQKSGLEWMYRVCQEPRRLGPRYLRTNPAFAWGICRHPPRACPPPTPGDSAHS